MSPIDGGFILLARSIFDNTDVFDGCSPLRLKLWVWMLGRANWKDRDKLSRGQFITTIDEMREAMSYWVGGRKETPSKDQIRNVYEAFSKATMITTAKTTRGMIITVNNYETYQEFSNYETHTETRFSPEASPKPTTKPTTKPTQDGDKQQDNSSDCVDNCITETHTETRAENSPKPTATPHDTESIRKQNKEKDKKTVQPPSLEKGILVGVTPEYIAKLEVKYPDVTIEHEIEKMRSWLESNPNKAKKRSNAHLFICNWLDKAKSETPKPTRSCRPNQRRVSLDEMYLEVLQ